MHDRQHYELVSYRRADAELNYRRFFAITTPGRDPRRGPGRLRRVARRGQAAGWTAAGSNGLRIDHPDGLADPGRYLDELAELAAVAGGSYVVVEKITRGRRARCRNHWRAREPPGTTRSALVDRLFVDPRGEEPLDELDTELRAGLTVDWPAMTRATKRAVADGILRSEVLRLGPAGARHPARRRRSRRAAELVLRCTGPICRRDGAESRRGRSSGRCRTRPELAGTLREVAEPAPRRRH